MPVSFGLRDEENERINNQLKKLISLVLMPGMPDTRAIEQLFEELGFSLPRLLEPDADALNRLLAEKQVDWANMELFADILAEMGKYPNREELKHKALSLYKFIQAESKMLSFEILRKLNDLK